jgi:glycosyltransferase involved in cell wall biosynthesis
MIRVLQFSTHQENCGIARYQEQFVSEVSEGDDVKTDFFDYSPNVIKLMNKNELKVVLGKLEDKLKDYDILHIQHEFSFYYSDELSRIVGIANKLNKKVIVTVHTSPEAQLERPEFIGIGIGRVKQYIKHQISTKRFMDRYITPLKSVDLILVHNSTTKDGLVSLGIDENSIKLIRIPVPEKATKHSDTREIRDKLNYSEGDVIYCTVGFLSKNKGIIHAVRSLQYLPDNYKLAIIGGVHPQGNNEKYLDKVTTLISDLGLMDRVYITGYVEDDGILNSLIDECDICIYPFDANYYNYASSASLNNALTNQKPVIAYRTRPFEEVSSDIDFISFTKSANYYELARSITEIDIEGSKAKSRKYAEKYSYNKEAKNLSSIYRDIAATRI